MDLTAIEIDKLVEAMAKVYDGPPLLTLVVADRMVEPLQAWWGPSVKVIARSSTYLDTTDGA